MHFTPTANVVELIERNQEADKECDRLRHLIYSIRKATRCPDSVGILAHVIAMDQRLHPELPRPTPGEWRKVNE